MFRLFLLDVLALVIDNFERPDGYMLCLFIQHREDRNLLFIYLF